MTAFHVPLIIRGEIINDRDVEFGGRRPGTRFTTADVTRHLGKLPLCAPSELADLYSVSFEEILDYLGELGKNLDFAKNPYLQEAYELSINTSGLTKEILRAFYANVRDLYQPFFVRSMTEAGVGVRYLEGWIETRMPNGCLAGVRAFGARAAHVLAGNIPAPSASAVLRNAVTRSDAILKTPSNDPMTAAAIARTMIDMAPRHPLTRHITVAYWKGGDARVEDVLYQPDNIEKIIAWGGFASVKHITKYVQPGIDLITLDPKLSSSIIGREAFADETTMREVADRLAIDIGNANQETCANARTIYIETGTDKNGIATAERFGEMVYASIQALPAHLSAPAHAVLPQLAEEIQSLKMVSTSHKIFGDSKSGAVIVSRIPEPVDFARLLANRVANLVPVDDMEIPIRSVTAYTQTIGIYPDSLKKRLRDRLVFHGAQRIVSLGYALKLSYAGPHDGLEILRRMCKWIVDETYVPQEVGLLTQTPAA